MQTIITPIENGEAWQVQVNFVDPDAAQLLAIAGQAANTATEAKDAAVGAAGVSVENANAAIAAKVATETLAGQVQTNAANAATSASNAAISATEAKEAKAIFYGFISSTSYTPTSDELLKSGYWSTKTAGTYTNMGGLVVSSGDLALNQDIRLYYNKTTNTWRKVLQGQDLGGYVQDADLFYRKNLFDKTSLVSGVYINTNSGALVSNGTSKVSSLIPVEAGQKYFLSGRTSSDRGFRFLNSSGVPLKALDNDGVPYLTYASGPLNGIYQAPTGAVSAQFTVIFVGSGSENLVQFEKGNVQSDYESYDSFKINPELIPKEGKIRLIKTGPSVVISSKLDSENKAVIIWNKDTDKNTLWNPTYININGTRMEMGGDDNCPIKLSSGYIGGNHGSIRNLKVTVTAHGKTLADVGSKWLDSAGVTWFLLKIIDANSVYLHSANQSGSTVWVFKSTISGTLTHVSGAANTSNIIVSSFVEEQLYPCNLIKKEGFELDGVKLEDDGDYQGESLILIENYDIFDIPSMMNFLHDNRPVGGYLTQPDFRFGDVYISLKNTYRFQKGCGYTIQTDFINRKAIALEYFGGTQHQYYKPTVSTAVKRYVPFALPVSGFDFREKVDLVSNSFASSIVIKETNWEDGIAPMRSTDIHEGSINVNYTIGYLPVGSGANRETYINDTFMFSTSKKNYPYAIGSKTLVSGAVPANSVFQIVSFRGHSVRTSERTNLYVSYFGNNAYLMADWHTSGTDEVPIPDDLQGRSFEIVNKTSNVSVVGNLLGSVLEIVISANTPMYGSIMIKVI